MPRVVSFEIHADDPERAIKFYGEVFHWEFTRWHGHQEYWLIQTGPDAQPGINGGLIRRKCPIQGEGVSAYVCTIDVPCLEESLKAAEAHGALVVAPQMRVPGVGWLAYIRDSEHNVLGLRQAEPQENCA